jgi:hypothetical protein
LWWCWSTKFVHNFWIGDRCIHALASAAAAQLAWRRTSRQRHGSFAAIERERTGHAHELIGFFASLAPLPCCLSPERIADAGYSEPAISLLLLLQ